MAPRRVHAEPGNAFGELEDRALTPAQAKM